MMSSVLACHDYVLADFWVLAWQTTVPEIDFDARRPWILDHVEMMRAQGQVVRGYFEAGVPLGFYTLFANTGLVEQICVNPSAAGRGIGAHLIGDAEQYSKEDLNLVVNEDNAKARGFYAKLGFKEIGKGVNPASLRAVVTLQMTAKSG